MRENNNIRTRTETREGDKQMVKIKSHGVEKDGGGGGGARDKVDIVTHKQIFLLFQLSNLPSAMKLKARERFL